MKEKSSIESSTSSLNDVEKLNEDNILARQLSRVMSNEQSVEKLENLNRVLSKSHREKLEVDQESFELKELLTSIVHRSTNEGLGINKVGITFKGMTSLGVDNAAKFGDSMYELGRTLVTLPFEIRKSMNQPLRKIIQGVDGIIEPGEMLLVLGRPGAGCSTLLKTIAGDTGQLKGVEGEILYDGVTQKDMMKNFKSDIIYNPEMDIHFPHLNVDQTLRFAVASKTPRMRLDNMSRKEFEDLKVQMLATVFGLRHALKTKVGNEYIRGCSGGERKRVALAEALATNASFYSWDNCTRGLDSSSALEFTEIIRNFTTILGNTAAVAIYQASENIYDLFDKVTVMYSGRQVYFGPTSEAKRYFEDMGYQCPSRQTTSEFLTAITDPHARFTQPGVDNIPETAEEFEQYWKNSPQYQKLQQDIAEYNSGKSSTETIEKFHQVNAQVKMKHQRERSKYVLSYAAQMRLGIKRGFQRIINDMDYTVSNTVGTILQGLITGSLFYQASESTSGAFSRGGVMFFALLMNTMTEMAEIPLSFQYRPILVKQKGYSFFHPSIEALQRMVTYFPFKLFTITIFSLILYFLSGLNTTPGQFFLYYFIINIAALATGAMFQGLAALSTTAEMANSGAGLILTVVLIYAGYMIPEPSQTWSHFISYINPLSYAFGGLMANEFHNREMPCDLLVPSGPGYDDLPIDYKVCGFVGSEPGRDTVLGDSYIDLSFNYQWSNVYRNLGIVIAFWVFFVIINTAATEFLRQVGGGGDVLLFKRGYMPEGKIEEGQVADEEALNGRLTATGSTEIFSWQGINYTVPVKDGHRQLLVDQQGYIKPGTLTALVGASGAGKSTLLSVLSQGVKTGVVDGSLLVNGKPIDASFKRRCGYVQQQDIHMAEYTVRESLVFAARLRQPAHIPDSEKLEYVEKIISLLGMTHYAEAYVGQWGQGLNVEQRKKLSIGVELVARPSLLLFLDEPTSGLDSQSAAHIVDFLKSLAACGQAILCTIHQPSSTVFEKFDRLLLLKKGGRTVYFGDLGPNSSTLLGYFERQGARKCSPHENPAEYILECIGAGASAHVSTDWADLWDNSPECSAVTREIQDMNHELEALPVSDNTHLTSKFAASYWNQFRYVYLRTLTQFWRSPSYIMAKFALMVFGGVFVGFSFYNVGHAVADLNNVMFVVFLSVIIAVPLAQQIQEFAIVCRELYEAREAASNTYHWSTLLLAQFCTEVPYMIFMSTLMYIPLYLAPKFDTGATMAGYFYLVWNVLYQMYYISFSLWLGYCTPDVPTAAIVTSILFSFVIAFCGVVQPVSQMPNFWHFVNRVSPLTYFVQSLLGDILHDRPVVCDTKELNVFQPPDGLTCYQYANPFVEAVSGYLNNPNATSSCEYCVYKNGDQYMDTINLDYGSQRWRNVGFFFVYIGFNLAIMLFSYYIFRVKVWRMPKWLKRGKKEAA